MTKVFVAKPPVPVTPLTPNQSYRLTPEARAIQEPEIETPLTYDIPGKGRYAPSDGYEFNFELNVLDSTSKLPIRAVPVEAGLKKGFTDRLGRISLTLPRGFNKVVLDGHGYLEKGAFAPEALKFDPIILEVDLDSDAVYTVYSTGEMIPGERKVLNNPGHGSINSSELEAWLRANWWILVLGGGAGIGLYYLGKSRNSPT